MEVPCHRRISFTPTYQQPASEKIKRDLFVPIVIGPKGPAADTLIHLPPNTSRLEMGSSNPLDNSTLESGSANRYAETHIDNCLLARNTESEEGEGSQFSADYYALPGRPGSSALGCHSR